MREFEVVSEYEDQGINLPKRSTKSSAGYDFESAENVVIRPIWEHIFQVLTYRLEITASQKYHKELIEPTIVKTGVKARMQEDEALFLYNRSSNPIKRFLWMSNGVGVIDSDYYGNEGNEGHIMFQFINFGIKPVVIYKGERIGQGVFKKFLKVRGDTANQKRKGGHGSTNE